MNKVTSCVVALWLVASLPGCDDDEDSALDAGKAGDGGGGVEDGSAGPDIDGGIPARCELPFDPGPCDANISAYWFNAEAGRCEHETYGGCEGNGNRFETQEACETACLDPDSVACVADEECGWGEIEHEILEPSDCICLYGCPYIPLNTATIARRSQQHVALCDPRRDGAGELCGIDDCIQPSAAMCVEGQCTGDLYAR